MVVAVVVSAVALIVHYSVYMGHTCGRGHGLTSTMNNGRNIYVSLFARSLENPLDPTPAWPQSVAAVNAEDRVFPDSTEFVRWVVTAGVMNVDFSFFAAPGMPGEKSQDPALFRARNNAWAITVGVNDELPDGVPVLFTANFSQDRKKFIPLESLTNDTYLARNALPFGDEAGVVVLNGGSAFTVKPGTITPDFFRTMGATNAVLYP